MNFLITNDPKNGHITINDACGFRAAFIDSGSRLWINNDVALDATDARNLARALHVWAERRRKIDQELLVNLDCPNCSRPLHSGACG